MREGVKLLERDWTLFFSGVAQDVARVGVGILTSPWLSIAKLKFIPVDGRVKKKSSEYLALLETLNGVPHGALMRDSIVLQGDFNTLMGKGGGA